MDGHANRWADRGLGRWEVGGWEGEWVGVR